MTACLVLAYSYRGVSFPEEAMHLLAPRTKRRVLNQLGRFALIGAVVAAPVPVALAGTASTTMPINASVVPQCLVSAVALNFGTYDPIGANAASPLDAQTTITLQCIRNTSYSVSLDQGQNGTAAVRNMIDAASGTLLHYELYSDSSHSTVWNATTPVTGTAPSRAPIGLTVYGEVPAAQDVVAASYADTIAVTVNF